MMLIFVLAVGVGGFLLYNKWKAQPVSTPAVSSTVSTNVTATPEQVGSYWLELERANQEGLRKVAGLSPIASGQTLKLHFTFSEDGYLYLIGPAGDTNQPTAFLTAKPPQGSGLSTNKVTRGVDFSFPSGSNWLSLDKNPGTDTFKVIFSKTQLTTPAFLSQPVTLEPLTQAQLIEMNQLAVTYKDSQGIVELDDSNKQAPSVRIKAAAGQTNNLIIFDVRIQHNKPAAAQ